MGYIAPVNNYQYQQYAERVAMKSYDPYYLTPVSRISPYNRSNKKFQDQLEREIEAKSDLETKLKKRITAESQPAVPSLPAPHIIPNFTGKGLHINETV